MVEVGLKVVRGPHWSKENEDGGEGYTGTLYGINVADKTAIIQWDNGNQTLCNIGRRNRYELRILDNAQIGIFHQNISCDECNSGESSRRETRNISNDSFSMNEIINSTSSIPQLNSIHSRNKTQECIHKGVQCDECKILNIHGIRYKCNYCLNFDLCHVCYEGNKHNQHKSFKRIDLPFSRGVDMPPRDHSSRRARREAVHRGITCDNCGLRDINGIRYKCNDCQDYDLCELCYEKDEHDLTHKFKRLYTSHSKGTNLPPRLELQEAVHRGVECDECKTLNICGTRYMCYNCVNFDLCQICYYKNKHDLRHSFIKIDLPFDEGVFLQSRSEGMHHPVNIHTGVQCDECGTHNICGNRYKCNICYNYDLCESCYEEDKHNLNHIFIKKESQFDGGIILQPRVIPRFERVRNQDHIHHGTICNECNLDDIYGMRYTCNNCFNYDLCYLCYHGDKHNLDHEFKRLESPNSVGVHLPPRSRSRKCPIKGIFKGAKVIPGIDWLWESKDKPGVVLDIQSFNNTTWRSAALIKWDRRITQLHRLGHEGHCEIQFVKAASGDSHYYYPEHLPILSLTKEPLQLDQSTHFSDAEEYLLLEELSINESRTSQDTPTSEKLFLNEASGISQLTTDTSKNKHHENIPRSNTTDDRVKSLEKKIAELEQNHNCPICWENKRNIVFLCGHGACNQCAENLQICHMCRKDITRKIHMY